MFSLFCEQTLPEIFGDTFGTLKRNYNHQIHEY